MATDPAGIESGSACYCMTGTVYERAVIYLLNQIAGGTLTPAQIEQNSACYCFTGTTFERAAIYLLAQILAGGGGGGGGGSGVTNMALGGSAPPADGSVPTKIVFDTDTGQLWYNSGSIPTPTWNNV